MKSQRAYQILVVFMLIFPLTIFSQQQMPLFAQKTPHVLMSPGNSGVQNMRGEPGYLRYSFPDNRIRFLSPEPFVSATKTANTNFIIQPLPFFCRKELQFEKNTSIPLRVRLGSLDYVNKLEGKENHWSMAPRN